MAIIRGIKSTAPATNSNDSTSDRAKPKIYANIGYESEVKDPETGKPIFISLPLGSGLDTMNPAVKRGRDSNYHNIVDAKNELLEDLLNYARENLDSGEEEVITELKVQIRVVHEVEETVAGDNPYRTTLSRMSFAQNS